MALTEPRVRGRAEVGGRLISFDAGVASRLSLQAAFDGGVRVRDGEILDWVEIEGAQRVRLGRCRFACDDGAVAASTGRLVFLDDVYDCRALVEDGKCTDLHGFFENLPLVLAQRELIRSEFREYCANVAYDLSVYKRFFDEQDRLLRDEPTDVAEAASAALLRTEGRKFLRFLNVKIAELETIVASFSKEEHERHGFYLRRHLWPYLLASECLKRTNLKPAGYSGDAELMVMLYENVFRGSSTFERLMHKYPVETRAAEAVRSRRRFVPRMLRELQGLGPAEHPFRFMSLACGPGYELEDIFVARSDVQRFECSLLDQDPNALGLSRAVVRRIEAQRGGSIKAHYFQDSVRTMLRTRDLRARFGLFQFIYSMGLFDYLTEPVARAVLARTFELLAPGGVIVLGNFHATSPTRVFMDYWADWPLTYRTEESFMAIADGLPLASARIEFDATGCQMFLRLERAA